MKTWPNERLSTVAKIDRTSILPSDIRSGTRYIGLEHIEAGGQLLDVSAVQNGDLASNKFRFGPRHILYGKLRPYLAKIALPDFDGICSTDILPILPSPKVDKNYLAHFLRQPMMVNYAASRSEGVNLPRLSPKALAEFEIPMPPLKEQKRIAAILDQANNLRRLRQRALDRLNTLGQAIFYEMFGDPTTNPMKWDSCCLADFISDVTNGMTRRRKENEKGRDIVLRLRDVRNGWIDFSELNRITLETKETTKHLLQVGDLLFIRVNGNPEYVGRCAVFEGFSEPVYFNDHVMRVRIDPAKIRPKFLSFVLSSPHGKREIAQHRKTSAGQHTINQDGLGKVHTFLPPLMLQKKFEEKLSSLGQQLSVHARALEYSDALFASLQHRAFHGEL